MSDGSTKEWQQELFGEFEPSGPKQPERIPALSKNQKPIFLSTTIEQVLLAGIIAILVLCAIFFLGVLRGKSIRAEASRASTAAQSVAAAAPVRSAVAQPARIDQGTRSTLTAPAIKPTPNPDRLVEKTAGPQPGSYTIQVVTYRNKDLAESEAKAIRKLGLSSFVVPNGAYYEVYAGEYTTKEAAKKGLPALASRYKGSFVRRR